MLPGIMASMSSFSDSFTQVPSIQDSYLATRARLSLGSSARHWITESSKMMSDSRSRVSSATRYSLARARE